MQGADSVCDTMVIISMVIISTLCCNWFASCRFFPVDGLGTLNYCKIGRRRTPQEEFCFSCLQVVLCILSCFEINSMIMWWRIDNTFTMQLGDFTVCFSGVRRLPNFAVVQGIRNVILLWLRTGITQRVKKSNRRGTVVIFEWMIVSLGYNDSDSWSS